MWQFNTQTLYCLINRPSYCIYASSNTACFCTGIRYVHIMLNQGFMTRKNRLRTSHYCVNTLILLKRSLQPKTNARKRVWVQWSVIGGTLTVNFQRDHHSSPTCLNTIYVKLIPHIFFLKTLLILVLNCVVQCQCSALSNSLCHFTPLNLHYSDIIFCCMYLNVKDTVHVPYLQMLWGATI